jgi:hypothetical protein
VQIEKELVWFGWVIDLSVTEGVTYVICYRVVETLDFARSDVFSGMR